jgi:hypothetical protein
MNAYERFEQIVVLALSPALASVIITALLKLWRRLIPFLIDKRDASYTFRECQLAGFAHCPFVGIEGTTIISNPLKLCALFCASDRKVVMEIERNRQNTAHPGRDEKASNGGQNHGSGPEQTSSQPKQGNAEREDWTDRIPQDPCTDINPTGWPGVQPPDNKESTASPDTASVHQDLPYVKAPDSASSEQLASGTNAHLDANPHLNDQHDKGKEGHDVPSSDPESGA